MPIVQTNDSAFYKDAYGNAAAAGVVYTLTPGTGGAGSVVLASNMAIAAGGNTVAVPAIARGTYVWDATFTGTGPLRLQALGSDGTTWRDIATLSATGTLAGEVRTGANATLQLASANALTAVSSVLS